MGIKISGLPAAGTLDGTELIELVQAGANKKVLASAFAALVPQIITTSGAPDKSVGINGSYAIDLAAKLWYGPKAGGAWPAPVSLKGDTGIKGDIGPVGNSLLRPSAALVSVAGVVKIDLAASIEVFNLTLTENVTSWTFTNPPPAGRIAEIRIVVSQATAGTAYTCVSPASAAGLTAGGAWVNSTALGAVESLGVAIDSAGNRSVFPSGVYA